jgi:hypothetical protein
MIEVPEEAIEAGAMALRSPSARKGPPAPDLVEIWKRDARKVLGAAAPLIVAANRLTLPEPDESPRLSGAPMWTLSEDVEVWVGSKPSPFVAVTGCDDMGPEEAERLALALLAAAAQAQADACGEGQQ